MKKFVSILFLLLFVTSADSANVFNPLNGDFDMCITVKEDDGSPSNEYCQDIKVTDGSLTDNGDGTFTLGTVGGGLSDVDSVGNCDEGACLDGTSDGWSEVELYSPGGGQSFFYFENKDGSADTYFQFDKSEGTVKLYVLGSFEQQWPEIVTDQFLLLQDNSFLLLQDGGKLILN